MSSGGSGLSSLSKWDYHEYICPKSPESKALM